MPAKSITVRILGTREILGPDGHAITALLAQPKRLGLLVFLLADRPVRAHPRDELLALFWPELPEDRARNALSQAISFIRRSIGVDAITGIGSDEIAVDSALVACDATAFAAAIAEGDHSAALCFYRGPLLDAFHVDGASDFEHWLALERTYLGREAAACARRLSATAVAKSDFDGALEWASRGRSIDPDDEFFVAQVMECHDRLGAQAKAMRAYDEFAKHLASELEVVPSAELRGRAERMRTRAAVAALSAQPDEHASTSITNRRRPRSRRVRMLGTVAVATLGIAAAVVKRASHGGTAALEAHSRTAIVFPDSVGLRAEVGGPVIALSPDGSRLAYVGGLRTQRLYLRAISDLTPRPLAGTEGARRPQFSPDGKWLAFTRDGALNKLPVTGGVIEQVADSAAQFSWGDGDVIVFSHALSSLWIKVGSSAPVPLTYVDTSRGEIRHNWPHLLPGANVALFEIQTGDLATSELAAVRISDHAVVRLGIQGHDPRYVDGRIVFGQRGGTLATVRFNATTLRVTSPVDTLLDNVLVKSGGATEIAISAIGTLLYLEASSTRQVLFVDRAGRVAPSLLGAKAYGQPRFSPDGQRLAFQVRDSDGWDIWTALVATGTLTRSTEGGRNTHPNWAPDGVHLLWSSGTDIDSDVKWQRWDAAGAASTLARHVSRPALSPTGRFFVAWHPPPRNSFAVLSLDSSMAERQIVSASNFDLMPKVSPDGKWLAYVRQTSGWRDVWVCRTDRADQPHRISVEGGTEPVWGATSKELFYRAAGKFVRAELALGPQVRVARVDTLFDDAFWSQPTANAADYDVTRDGTRFVVLRPVGGSAQLIMVAGWVDELRKRNGGRSN